MLASVGIDPDAPWGPGQMIPAERYYEMIERIAEQIDATDRLDEYNSNAYDETTNPRGLAQGGHRTNFPAALSDLELAADGVKVLADDADSLAGDAADAQAAAITAQGGAEQARTDAETARDAAQEAATDAHEAVTLAGSGDFIGNVTVGGDLLVDLARQNGRKFVRKAFHPTSELARVG